jgi:predicted GIY-YIG superfamily endonuclease
MDRAVEAGLPRLTPGGAEVHLHKGGPGRGWLHLFLMRDCLEPCPSEMATVVHDIAICQRDKYLTERGKRPRSVAWNNERAHPQWSMPCHDSELIDLFTVLVAVESGDLDTGRAWIGGEKPDVLPDPHDVYVYRSAAGEVLYVGQSYDYRMRYIQHRMARAPWVPHWRHLEVERLPTRELAMLRELELIKALDPKYNVRHKPT